MCALLLTVGCAEIAQPVPEDPDPKLTYDQAIPLTTLTRFLEFLSEEDLSSAYELVDAVTKESGDPVAYKTPVDFDSFVREVKAVGFIKFENYKVESIRWESANRCRILLLLAGWDRDETTLVRHGGHWFVTDPIHIIR